MGMFTNLMKKMKLVEDEDALTPEQKKQKTAAARASLAKRTKKLEDAPLNQFQRKAKELKLNK